MVPVVENHHHVGASLGPSRGELAYPPPGPNPVGISLNGTYVTYVSTGILQGTLAALALIICNHPYNQFQFLLFPLVFLNASPPHEEKNRRVGGTGIRFECEKFSRQI